MAAIKSLIARNWFPLLAGVAGLILYISLAAALARIDRGILATFVGWVIASFIQKTWRLYKNRNELRTEYQRLTSTYADVHPAREGPRAAQILVWAFFAYFVFLLFYSIVISVGHSSAALVQWMRSVQPAVDWLAPLIPALRKIPLKLVEWGHADWAPAVQHMLFVCWVLTFVLMIWIVLEVMVIHGRVSNEAFFSHGWRFGKRPLLGSVVLTMLLPILFFGWTAPVLSLGAVFGSLGAVFGLPCLALLFPGMVIFFFELVEWCNAFLHRSDSSVEGVEDARLKALYDDTLNTLHRVLDGKSKQDGRVG